MLPLPTHVLLYPRMTHDFHMPCGTGAIKMMDGSFLNIGDKATFSRNIAGFGGGEKLVP